jgi:hypothetical protein
MAGKEIEAANSSKYCGRCIHMLLVLLNTCISILYFNYSIVRTDQTKVSCGRLLVVVRPALTASSVGSAKYTRRTDIEDRQEAAADVQKEEQLMGYMASSVAHIMTFVRRVW